MIEKSFICELIFVYNFFIKGNRLATQVMHTIPVEQRMAYLRRAFRNYPRRYQIAVARQNSPEGLPGVARVEHGERLAVTAAGVGLA